MKRLLLLFAIVAFLTHPPGADAQMTLKPVVVAPGNTSTVGSLQMLGTVGQPCVGFTTAAPLGCNFGFGPPMGEHLFRSLVPVLFSSVDTKIVDRSVAVSWLVSITDEETHFNVYRRENDTAEFKRLNKDPIPFGEELGYIDKTIRPARRYEYVVGAMEEGVETLSLSAVTTTPAWRTELRQNYPNPFNPTTTIAFYLAEPGAVSIRVFNVKGQLVRELLDYSLGHGKHEITWDATNNRGSSVASGVYFYRLTTRNESFTKRMMVLK